MRGVINKICNESRERPLKLSEEKLFLIYYRLFLKAKIHGGSTVSDRPG